MRNCLTILVICTGILLFGCSKEPSLEDRAAQELERGAKAKVEMAKLVEAKITGRSISSKELVMMTGNVASVTIELKNVGADSVSAVKGRIEIKDIFGQSAGAIPIESDKTLSAGQVIQLNKSVVTGKLIGGEKTLADLEDGKWVATWSPEVIVFLSGKKIDARTDENLMREIDAQMSKRSR